MLKLRLVGDRAHHEAGGDEIGEIELAQQAQGIKQEGGQEQQRQQFGEVPVEIAASQAKAQQRRGSHSAAEPFVLQLGAEIISEPDGQQHRDRSNAQLNQRNGLIELAAQIADRACRPGAMRTLSPGWYGASELNEPPSRAARLWTPLICPASPWGAAIAVGLSEQERHKGEEGQVGRPGPALIAVCQPLAAGFGAGLGGGERSAEDYRREQGEKYIIHHQRVPAESFGVEHGATHDKTQAKDRGESDSWLSRTPGGGEHRARAEQHRREYEEDEQAHCGRAGLPDALDRVLVKGGVAGEDGQILNLALRDKQTVEWVTVVERQLGNALKISEN